MYPSTQSHDSIVDLDNQPRFPGIRLQPLGHVGFVSMVYYFDNAQSFQPNYGLSLMGVQTGTGPPRAVYANVCLL